MKYWLVNHSWESFRRTQEYCGFISEEERNKIQVGNKIVYFGQAIVFGLFEVIELPDNEFKGWQKSYPFQVKLKSILIPKGGLLAKVLESKLLLQKSEGGSSNLVELSEIEFDQIKLAIKNNL
ncbi:MAG: hypothetical protein Q7S92_00820, partial [Candidatus Diapherotrites archaeon]|nr:hypothetical protein [Candidatus Diapherotrites archaeon]